MSYKNDLEAEFRSVGNKLHIYERWTTREGKRLARVVLTGVGYAPATKPVFWEYEDDTEEGLPVEQVSWNFAEAYEKTQSELRRAKSLKFQESLARYLRKKKP